ncbi:putative Electron transfer flavoprotein beta-subunit [Desulfosarcina cetonica]|uniref:electron transfer flavoprotein subunit beta/FixA family protein n=1 Tax=Desulfosarcina cetonica TaxID=90730 RepID=UPI0009F9023E|nr:electron transfer flavoprotein subunit beta/FixA family protein [Desulfosarcina cetonica]VTR69102.1 putative Electron transfer flavoprotein beta-subunit [Desulfosarcina cetonica]
MRIAVLVKHVVDSTEVRFDVNTGDLRLRGLPEKISDYDKHAIEAAVRIKSELKATVTAFSYGSKAALKSLKEAVAMGVDDGVLIADPSADKGFDPIYTADVLYRAIQHHGGADLILSGAMTEDMTHMITSPALAFYAGIPHIANVIKIASVRENEIEGVFEADGYENTFKASLPLAISVTRKLNDPRLATKIQILKVPVKKIATISLDDLGIPPGGEDGPQATFDAYAPITKDRKKLIIDGDPAQMVTTLIQKIKEENLL